VEDSKAYIESGILELYVLGELTAPERMEVERIAAAFEEVRAEIAAIEIALEQYALAGAIEPSEAPLRNLMETLTQGQKASGTPSAVPANEPVIKTLTPPENTPASGVKLKRLQYALAACVALLVVSVIALVSMRTKLESAETQLISLRTEKDRLATRANMLQQTSSELQRVADMVNDPNWAIVKLAGTKVSPASNLTVYWNKESEDVVVDQSRMALPTNDPAHQYQLWALVEGKPVSLGVFDMKPDSAEMLLIMKEISQAQAFAVTLEKRGGSVNPTMENLMVMGGVTAK
jgi:anti-sigma-K factor RskA